MVSLAVGGGKVEFRLSSVELPPNPYVPGEVGAFIDQLASPGAPGHSGMGDPRGSGPGPSQSILRLPFRNLAGRTVEPSPDGPGAMG